MEPQKRTPCDKVCDCEWGSKRCMQKRGYIWNYALHEWCRDEHGMILRSANRECSHARPEQLTLF